MNSDKIIETINNADILDAHDMATVERALKMLDMYDIMLNEAIGPQIECNGKWSMPSNYFGFKYQVGQAFGHKKFCKDCKQFVTERNWSGIGTVTSCDKLDKIVDSYEQHSECFEEKGDESS